MAGGGPRPWALDKPAVFHPFATRVPSSVCSSVGLRGRGPDAPGRPFARGRFAADGRHTGLRDGATRSYQGARLLLCVSSAVAVPGWVVRLPPHCASCSSAAPSLSLGPHRRSPWCRLIAMLQPPALARGGACSGRAMNRALERGLRARGCSRDQLPRRERRLQPPRHVSASQLGGPQGSRCRTTVVPRPSRRRFSYVAIRLLCSEMGDSEMSDSWSGDVRGGSRRRSVFDPRGRVARGLLCLEERVALRRSRGLAAPALRRDSPHARGGSWSPGRALTDSRSSNRSSVHRPCGPRTWSTRTSSRSKGHRAAALRLRPVPRLDELGTDRDAASGRSSEHFPLTEGRTPGVGLLRTRRGRTRRWSLELQRRHLAHYGELAPGPHESAPGLRDRRGLCRPNRGAGQGESSRSCPSIEWSPT
jgi:hypothetical protein